MWRSWYIKLHYYNYRYKIILYHHYICRNDDWSNLQLQVVSQTFSSNSLTINAGSEDGVTITNVYKAGYDIASIVIIGTGAAKAIVRTFMFQTDNKIYAIVDNFSNGAVTVAVNVAVFFVRLVKS